jgi:hypothetical protein
MRGYIRQEPTDEVEKARVRHSEECELRLARIQNGAEPSHKNGPHVVKLFAVVIEGKAGWQWQSTSGRVSPVFRGHTRADEWRTSHPAWD